MLFLAWILALALLTWFFSDLLERRENPNASPETRSTENLREVILQRNRQGHYVANGLINGHSVVFFLDTGATTIAVPERVAQRIGLRRGAEIEVGTANGRVRNYLTRLDRVELGHIVQENVRATINPYMQGDEILLGMSFLKNLELIQRPQDNILVLRQYRE